MLARWTNGSQFGFRLRDEMDRLLNNVFETVGADAPFSVMGVRTFPALNIWDEGNRLVAEAEVPGLKMDDLEVTVMNNELSIKGSRESCSPEGATVHRQERGVGAFSRVVRLPVEIDADRVEASLQHGVLTIRMPKSEAVMPRKIEVKNS